MSLSEQARCFLASLLLGFILSLLYDLLRAVRLRRATKRRFTSALDLLYCAAFALLTFLFSLRIGGGELRLYMLCSALLGAVSYFTLCARLFRPLWAFWAEVLFSFARLAAAPLRWLQKVYGKLAKLSQKSRVKAEKTKIFFQKASSGFGDVSFKERSGRFKA